MGVIRKYFKYLSTVGLRLLHDSPLFRKMCKHKEKYSYEQRYESAMSIISYATKKFKVNLNAQGLNKIPESNVVFVVNHQAYFDPFISQVIPKKVVWVAKKEIRKFPFIGDIAESIDTIFLNREDPRDAVKMIKQATQVLKEGKSLWVSIEGTRSKKADHSMNPFKPGALKPAYKAQKTIVPMVICGSWKVLDPNYLKTPIDVDVVFFDPIEYKDFKDLSTQELSDKLYKIMKEKDDELLVEQLKK